MATIPINDTAPRNSYTATAGQTVFPYTFWITADADLKVYKNGTLLTLTTDYTVSGALNTSGGNVTLTSGAALNDVIVIVRDVPIKRETEFATSGQFAATVLNLELSRLIAIAQQLETALGRTLALPDSSTVDTSSFELPSTFIDGRGLKWDAAQGKFVLTDNQIDSTVPQGVYLGAKASDPALDNEGNALEAGALYFNTTSGVLKVYDGSVWIQSNFDPDVDIAFTGNNTHAGTETFNGPIAATTAAIAASDELLFRDVSDSNNAKKATLLSAVTATLLDEDNFASDSDTQAPTQQSVKAYVDASSVRDLLASGTATNSAGVSFALPTGYKAFQLQVKNGTVAAANTDMVMELQRSTVAQSGYFTGHTVTNVTAGGFFAANSTSLQLHRTADLDNDAADQFNCDVLIIDPRNSGISTPYYCNSQVIIGAASPTAVYGNQVFGIIGGGANAGDDDTLVLKGATANFSGEYELWGIK